jgi:hypothetical protein
VKELEIDDAIRRDPELFAAVEHASRLLEEEIGPSAGQVSAEWQLFGADQQIPTVRVEISDSTGSAMTHFQRQMLPKLTDSALSLAFVRLWGDLLQVRSHKQTEKLKLMIRELETT